MVIRARFRFTRLLRNLLVATSLATAVTSCSKDPIRERPVDPPVPPDSVSYRSGCFVVNEGNYNWANASVTFIDLKTGDIQQDIFGSANQRALGDVAQSMTVFNGRGYIVVNNSNKIEVVSLDDFKTIKTIQGFSSPRYFEVVDSSKAYVTNLFGNISIVDLNSLEVTGTIETTDWTEGMVRYQQYVFITSIGKFSESTAVRKAKVFIINTKQDKIVDSIMTGKEPMGIVIDKKDKIWVLCTGGWDAFEPPALLRVNPDLREVEKAFIFDGNNSVPSRLCINPGKDTLYFLKDGIFRMPVASGTLPSQAFIPSEGKLFYGLDVDPYTGDLWTTNAVDYVQNGWVYQYNAAAGTLLKTYKAGRIPGSFAFSSED